MKKTLKLIVINEMRQNLKLLKNYGIAFLVVFVVAFFSKSWVMEAIVLIKDNHIYLNYAICVALTITFIFKKRAIISMNPATIHHLMGTSSLKNMLEIKLAECFFICVALSIILTLLSCNKFSISYFIHLTSLFSAWVLLKWHSYHKKNQYLYSICACILINAMYMCGFVYIGIAVNLIIMILLIIKPSVINWKKYFNDMKYYSIVKASAARKDYAVMMVLANENATKDKYMIPYINFDKVNPLITKSIIIDTLRRPVLTWGIKILALVISLSSFYVPLGNLYRICIFVAAWSYLISTITKSSVQAVLNLQVKCRQGLFIPFAPWKIAMSYTIFPLFEVIIANTLLAICADTSEWTITLMILCQIVVIYLWHFVSINHMSLRNKIDFIGCFIISIISFIYLYMRGL